MLFFALCALLASAAALTNTSVADDAPSVVYTPPVPPECVEAADAGFCNNGFTQRLGPGAIGFSGGSIHTGCGSNLVVTFAFNGERVILNTTLSTIGANVSLAIDGALVGTLNTNIPSGQAAPFQWVSPLLNSKAAHQLVITSLGHPTGQDPNSLSCFDIDGFVVQTGVTSSSSSKSSDGVSIGAIVGGAVAGVVALIVIGLLVWWCMMRRKERNGYRSRRSIIDNDFTSVNHHVTPFAPVMTSVGGSPASHMRSRSNASSPADSPEQTYAGHFGMPHVAGPSSDNGTYRSNSSVSRRGAPMQSPAMPPPIVTQNMQLRNPYSPESRQQSAESEDDDLIERLPHPSGSNASLACTSGSAASEHSTRPLLQHEGPRPGFKGYMPSEQEVHHHEEAPPSYHAG